MERAREKLSNIYPHYFNRVNSFYSFSPLSYEDADKILKELCEIKVDSEITKFIHTKSNGTMRTINKYIDAIERIGKRMKKTDLMFDEIKDIIVRVEA
jgi:DNA polymerase III delta prime subunit